MKQILYPLFIFSFSFSCFPSVLAYKKYYDDTSNFTSSKANLNENKISEKSVYSKWQLFKFIHDTTIISYLKLFSGHQCAVESVAFSPDGQSVLTGSDDLTVKLWDLSGKVKQTFEGHNSYIWSVTFSPDGQSILTGSEDGTAKLWDLTGKLKQTYKGHQLPVKSVAFSPDGQGILTGSEDGTAKLWTLFSK